MARARNIKPGFFKNEILAEMPPETRLLFMGLWCLADREGRFEDRPKKIKMELFPCDDFSIEDGLALLAEGGFLIRYEVEGRRYAQVVNFTKHQMPHHKEVPSEIPAPPGHAQVTKHAYNVSKEAREAVFDRDGRACLKCGATKSLSLDHVIPLASGGDNGVDNLQTLCTSCNSAKGSATKDYRKNNVTPTLSQQRNNDSARCPTDSLIPDSLNPESGEQASESLNRSSAPQAPTALAFVELSPEVEPAEAGTICKRLRDAGIQGVNPSHPKLLAVLQAGITADELCGIAAEPNAAGKGMAWVLATAEGRRRDAAKVRPLPRASPTLADRNRQAADEAKRLIFGQG